MHSPIARAPVPSSASMIEQVKAVPTKSATAVGTLTPLPATIPTIPVSVDSAAAAAVETDKLTDSLLSASTVADTVNDIATSALSATTNLNLLSAPSVSSSISSISSNILPSIVSSPIRSSQLPAITSVIKSSTFATSTRTSSTINPTSTVLSSSIKAVPPTSTIVDLSHPFTGTDNFVPNTTSLTGISANASDSDTSMPISTGGITALVFLGLFLIGLILIGWGKIVTCFGLRKGKRNAGISNETIGFDGHGMPRSTSWFLGAGDIKNMTRDARRRTKLRGRGITPSMFLEVPDLSNSTGEFEDKETDRLTDNKAGVGSFDYNSPIPPVPKSEQQRKRSSYLMQQANYTRPLSQQVIPSRPPSPATPLSNSAPTSTFDAFSAVETPQQYTGMPNFPPPSLAITPSESSDLIYNQPTNKLMLNEAAQMQIAQAQQPSVEPPVSIMVTSSSGRAFPKPASSIYSSDSLPRLPKLDSSSSIRLESLRNMNMDSHSNYNNINNNHNNRPVPQQPPKNWADAAYTAYIPDVPTQPSQKSAAARGLDEELARMDREFSTYMSRGI